MWVITAAFLLFQINSIFPATNEYIDTLNTNESCSSVSESAVSQCMAPILKYSATVEKTTPQSLKTFRELCTLYSKFEKCTDSITCRSVSKQGIDASYKYMCGDGFQVFEKHANCFAEVETKNEYLECKNTATAEIEKLAVFRNKEQKKYFNGLCKVMKRYLKCCRPHVITKCGRDAWSLVARITDDSLGVTMPECNVKSSL
uniref:DUF19 domain-containing protein n=1 Tax=Rhabditophanes sp. KR3021 TaxID=114890 RepID=A0AC35UGN3_9BILA